MEVVDNKNKEDYWIDCVDASKPFVVYVPRFGYGLFAYDLSPAFVMWTDKGLENVKNSFSTLYDKYRGDSKYVQVQEFNHEVGPVRGHIAVVDLDVKELCGTLEGFIQQEGNLEYGEVVHLEDYRPWVFWPNISGLK